MNTTNHPVVEASVISQEATSKWAKMRRGRKFTRATYWPDVPDIPIVLRVLSFSEVQESVADAAKRFRDLGLPTPANDLSFAEDFQDEICLQLTWRYARDPEDLNRPACSTVSEMRDCTTMAQRSAIYKEYRDLEDEIDPDPNSLSDEVMAEIEDAIKKKQSDRLRSYGSTTLSSYLLSLESPHAILPTTKSGNTDSDSKQSRSD